jgi:hypothetical protein
VSIERELRRANAELFLLQARGRWFEALLTGNGLDEAEAMYERAKRVVAEEGSDGRSDHEELGAGVPRSAA